MLIHGGHFGNYYCADHWGLNFDELYRSFHVYALDKLGQGFNDNPKGNTDILMGATIEHVYEFLRAVGINRATLLGHSREALPAVRIAVDHPEMVKAVVILDNNTVDADDPSTPNDFYQNWMGIPLRFRTGSLSAGNRRPIPIPGITSPTTLLRRCSQWHCFPRSMRPGKRCRIRWSLSSLIGYRKRCTKP